MIPSDNLQVLYKTERIILGKNLQYLHQQQQQQFAYVAKNYPKQKNAKKLPRTTICKFWERSDFAKDSSAAKIQIVQNKEA